MKNKILLTLIAVLFLLVGCIKGEMDMTCSLMPLRLSYREACIGTKPEEPVVFQSTHPIHQDRFLDIFEMKRGSVETGKISNEENSDWYKIEFSEDGKKISISPSGEKKWEFGKFYTITFKSPYVWSADLLHCYAQGVDMCFVPMNSYYVSSDGTGKPETATSWETATSDLGGLFKYLTETFEKISKIEKGRYVAWRDGKGFSIWITDGRWTITPDNSIEKISMEFCKIYGGIKKNATSIEEKEGYTTIIFDENVNLSLGQDWQIREGQQILNNLILKGGIFTFDYTSIIDSTLISESRTSNIGSTDVNGNYTSLLAENSIFYDIQSYPYFIWELPYISTDFVAATTPVKEADIFLSWRGKDTDDDIHFDVGGDYTGKPPRFVDPDNNDFRLRSDSCLLKTGKDGKNYGGWQGEGIAVPAP